MKTAPHRNSTSTRDECRRTRLAQSSVAAVDTCTCGVMQVHLGALTLRLAPRAVSELIATLGQAIAAHSALRLAEEGEAAPHPFHVCGRGQA